MKIEANRIQLTLSESKGSGILSARKPARFDYDASPSRQYLLAPGRMKIEANRIPLTLSESKGSGILFACKPARFDYDASPSRQYLPAPGHSVAA